MTHLKSIFCVMGLSVVALAEAADSSVTIDGTVHVPESVIPLSSYMSAEARRAFIEGSQRTPDPEWSNVDASAARLRQLDEEESRGLVARARARYAVHIEPRTFAGVPTQVITPREGIGLRNRERVLLNLHGGAFFSGANAEALLESIPIAAVGNYRVITVDYREGPEHAFPAASEDVALVYQELLKTHRPADIGIYGCSAGGTLSAMAVAWFQKHQLPRPGAIALLNSAALGDFAASPSEPGSWGGDSRFTAPPLNGEGVASLETGNTAAFPKVARAYLQSANLRDPLVSPALSPADLAKFPPTLVLTSTRGFDMSAAVQTHREMVKAGVEAELYVWDGVGHCFMTDVDLPESQEAFSVVTRFFDRRLTH